MIINTHYKKKALGSEYTGPKRISSREQKRLQFTNRPEVKQEIIPEETIEKEKEAAVVVKPIGETSQKDVKPGTAVIRSKALEELNEDYSKEPVKKPIKKYKVISLG